jgi:CDGSH-type Zn-finger protein/uncharacterized Fe-S cluster protein YjdI
MAESSIEVVVGKKATIRFNSALCIHSRGCVLSQPGVFKANVQGPWIDPDAANPDALIRVALNCPSGAIQVERSDGGPGETPPEVNTIALRENGPLAIHAAIEIDAKAVGTRATLCRCGASKNKPFCDGSHVAAAFVATGEPPSKNSEPLAVRGGPVTVALYANGPLGLRGNVEILSGTGRTIDRIKGAALCRCGGSKNKPFCDGTHKTIGFVAP